MFIKYAAYHLQQLNLRKAENTAKKEDEKKAIDNKEKEENSKDQQKEKDEKNDSNSDIEDAEAKKMIESITDGSKIERKLGNLILILMGIKL